MAPAALQSPSSPADKQQQEPVAQTVATAGTAGGGDSLITRNDLVAGSTDLKQHITSLLESNLDGINGQLKALNDSLKEVADTTSKAFDLATSNEKAVADVKQSEKALKDRLSALELKSRALNVKFRGMPESGQINDNLFSFMSTWITSILQQGGGSAPSITMAYRLGSSAQAKPNYPRDILVQFQCHKDKELVLSEARKQGSLRYNDHKIIALLDLPPEILQK